jgi:hypothetical protein
MHRRQRETLGHGDWRWFASSKACGTEMKSIAIARYKPQLGAIVTSPW